MSNIPQKVQAFLNQHKLSALESEPGSTPTAELAAQRIGVPAGRIAKSILFKGKDKQYRLVVAAGDKKIVREKGFQEFTCKPCFLYNKVGDTVRGK